jgi:two-component system CheB/CheR fusion protein
MNGTPRPDRLIELVAINRVIASPTDYDALLRLIVEKTASFLEANACVLLLADGGEIATVAASVGLPAERARAFATPLDERIAAEMCALFGCEPERLLVAPVIEGGQIQGVLAAYRQSAGDDDTDTFMLSALADHAAVALAHATHRRHLEEALAALRESDRRKDEFLAVLSHELRNPLAPVSNSVVVLRHAPAGDERARRALDVIERQVRHLNRLVDDLLDATRVTRGKLQLQLTNVDLREVVTRTTDDLSSVFTMAGVTLEVALPPAAIFVSGDAARLGQMLGNLLQNAAKFTKRGGKALVSLEADTTAQQAVLRVTDTGIGIDRDMMQHLFEPFAQADRTLARSRGGLGLGLALVKALAELHHGTIHAESAGPGLGATFTLRLPLIDGESEVSLAQRGRATTSPATYVLLIEDNPDAAESLREALELVGHYEVEVAADGRTGLARARELARTHDRPPEVVLCDIGLPDMDGYDVAREMRTDPLLHDALLVALTGYALPGDIRRAAEAGFDMHLPKPPNIDRIKEIISEAETFAR